MKPWLLIVWMVLPCCPPGYAQKGAGQMTATDIFADLPIDDPAANSVLQANEDPAAKIRKNIFVKGAFSRNRCFAGEPVLLTYELHTALQSTSTVHHPPALQGFIATPLETDNSEAKYRKTGGRSYRVFTILQWQLIPVKEGLLKVDSFQVNNKVKYRDNAGQTITYTGAVQGGMVKLQVAPLPEKNRPADFSGMIGRFTMAVFPLGNNLPAGANNTLQVEITGTGNFNPGHFPEVQWPEGIEAFEAKETLAVKEDAFPTTGRKIIELPFVARKEGKITIPAIRLSFFDPETGAYRSIAGEPVELNVMPAAAATVTAESPVQPVHPPGRNPVILYLSGIAGMLLILCLGWWIIRRFRKKQHQQTFTMQHPIIPENQDQQPETDFHAELQKLGKIPDSQEFIMEFKNLLTAYLQAGMGTAITLEEELVHKLRLKDGPLADAVQELYYQCNTLLYAPGDLPEIARTAMLEKLTGIHHKGSALWS